MVDLSVIGKKMGPMEYEYTWQDVVLYALGVGAQTDELQFIYENAPGGLKVLPSFSIKMRSGLLISNLRKIDMGGSHSVHGEQYIKLYRPLSPQGKVTSEGEISDIYDKGKNAVLVFRSKTFDENKELLCESESRAFYVGAGGFGGDPGPKAVPIDPPKGVQPDFSVSYPIPPNQAAIYRLNGDYNPLHLDPAVAHKAGYDRPILHGHCTYGYAVRAILHGACDGEVSRFKEFKARFSGEVYPGETLTIQGWHEGQGRYIIQCKTDRDVVLSHAYAVIDQ